MKRVFLIIPLLTSACALGPDYHRPVTAVPQAYKEASEMNGWKMAQPKDQQIRSAWWEAYQDESLNAFVQQAAAANQNLAIAEARYRQALALSNGYRASQYPTVTANTSSTRTKRSDNTTNSSADSITNNHAIGLNVSWEVDVWGRIKKQVEAGDAALQASAADIEVAKLSILSTLAQTYFQLRVFDTQQVLLEDTVKAYERSYTLTRNRYQAGVATKADVSQAESQIKTTQVLARDISLQRSQAEHAIAVLLGKAPSELSIKPNPFDKKTSLVIPAVPASLPAELLERRPDIAAAERRVASANANIGVAKTAFFPALTLGASAGFQSSSLGNLITTPSRIWSIGPLIALSVFDGGLRKSQTNAAIANYDATVATYQQTALAAFQEVEDNLVALDALSEEAILQESAVKAANEALQQSINRYKAGTIDYLNVAVLQTNTLNNQRNAIAIHGRRLQASIALIKAIGGGWDATKINETSTQ